MRKLYTSYLRLPMLSRLLAIIIVIISLGAWIARIAEPQTFPTYFEAFYWTVITVGTVGYGDYAPRTTAVRITAMILVFWGGAFLAFFTVHLASSVVKKQQGLLEGKMAFMEKNHCIIVGWNERTKETIMAYRTNQTNVKSMVLVDSSLTENPLYHEGIHFVKGSPVIDSTWIQAGIDQAKLILITADQSLSESDADMQTILSILAARGLNPTIEIAAEILTPEQEANSRRAGADILIQTSRITSQAMTAVLGSGTVDRRT
ncbi:ion channel [Fictibacillus iocasae]|uniref:Ion channel n=1 Tax=Fictibacillus iocasae TaxID=2715437 RepID=A0ABW2NRZ0_9BACL